MGNIENKKYWNIVKALSIISIVIGHSCFFMVRFVYLYHLAIFFFVAGYFYNEKKYGENPYLYFLSKIKANWKKFFCYTTFFVLIHNLLNKYGLVLNVDDYYVKNSILAIIDNSVFNITEGLSGALWFVPVYIAASVLFGIIVYYSLKCFKNNTTLKNLSIIYLSVMLAVLGLYINKKGFGLIYHLQTALLVVPFFTMGYFVRTYCKDIFKYLKLSIGILAVIVLYYYGYKQRIWINLSDNIINKWYIFYFISVIGFYFILYLAKIISKIKLVDNVFEIIGNYTFEIMTFHFLVFKVIDFIIGKLRGIEDKKIYGVFPYAFKGAWPIYIVGGTLIPVILFYLYDRYKDKIKDIIINIVKFLFKKLNSSFNFLMKYAEKRIIRILFLIVFICLISIPVLKLGIMHNDELMSRYWSMHGFKAFYSHYFVEQIQKGRTLSCVIIPFTMYLGYIGKSTYIFKGIQMLSIIICGITFGLIVKYCVKNKKIFYFYIFTFLGYLQISFEPTVPNVFVTFYNVSIFVLCISFLLYILYFKKNKNWLLYLSMFLYFIVELSYESFVTYVPIFCLIYLFNKDYKFKKKLSENIKNLFQVIRKDLKAILLPIIMGVLYLVLYVIFAKLFPSNYDGNKIEGINIVNTLMIILNVAKFSFPGSYIVSDKYEYLYSLYKELTIVDIVRNIALCLIMIYVLVGVIRKENNKLEKGMVIKLILIGFGLIVFPIIPISVAAMYQTWPLGTMVLGIPTTFFCYFGAVLIISTLMIWFVENHKIGMYIIMPIMIAVLIFVQNLNCSFAKEANRNYERLNEIEEFVSSGIFEKLNITQIYSTNIFETRNLLAIHNSYWNEYAKFKNINVNIVNKEGTINDTKVFFLEDSDCFQIINDKESYIVTKNDKLEKINIYEYQNDEKNIIEKDLIEEITKCGDWNVIKVK